MKKIILFILLCALKMQAQDNRSSDGFNSIGQTQQTCYVQNTVTDNFTINGEYERKASADLNSNSLVGDKTTVTFVSGNSILLKGGFYAAAGANFKGYIGDCSSIAATPNNTVSRKQVKGNLTMAPNPSSDVVNINFGDEQIARITLTSIDGKKVFEKQISNQNIYTLEVSRYPKGVYLLSVETNSGNRNTEKIIIQ